MWCHLGLSQLDEEEEEKCEGKEEEEGEEEEELEGQCIPLGLQLPPVFH